jgi:hypothetical protein
MFAALTPLAFAGDLSFLKKNERILLADAQGGRLCEAKVIRATPVEASLVTLNHTFDCGRKDRQLEISADRVARVSRIDSKTIQRKAISAAGAVGIMAVAAVSSGFPSAALGILHPIVALPIGAFGWTHAPPGHMNVLRLNCFVQDSCLAPQLPPTAPAAHLEILRQSPARPTE